MKKFFSISCLVMAIACTVVGCKDDLEDPIPVPPESKTLSLENFKILPAGFPLGDIAIRTDPSTNNVWALVSKGHHSGQTPVMQCFDSQFEPITGEWKVVTQKTCPPFLPLIDFAILADGSALCAYPQLESPGFSLVYYSIMKQDGTIVNGDGTLVYDIRNDFPDLKVCSVSSNRVIADGKGGAWIALSYEKMIVVRHLLPSLEMTAPVKIFIKGDEYKTSATNINLMLAEDGGLFMTEMDAISKSELSVWMTAHCNLIKIDAGCTSYTSTQITPEDSFNPASEVEFIPDTKGGAYLVSVEVDSSEHTMIISSGYMDKNGKAGKLKPVIDSPDYWKSSFAVVPSDNSLCIALCERGVIGEMVTGYSATLTTVNEASDKLLELQFKDFDEDANIRSISVIPRAGSVMDVCYVYFDREGAPITANAGVGTVNLSNKTIVPSVDTMPLTDYSNELGVMITPAKYVNGKVNIGWANVVSGGDIHVGQIVLK